MKLMTALWLIAAAMLSYSGPAMAKHRHHAAPLKVATPKCISNNDGKRVCPGIGPQEAVQRGFEHRRYGSRHRSEKTALRPFRGHFAQTGNCPSYLGCGCHLANDLGGIARFGRHVWRQLWVARNWARIGEPARKGCIGCVAVLSRGRGGHVGKVRGYDSHGNPILWSWGNRRVGWFTTTYSRTRVLAYRNL